MGTTRSTVVPRVSRTLTAISLCVASVWVSSGCSSYRPALPPGDYMRGHNYTFAAYDDEERLIHSPIEHLETALLTHRDEGRPISDVYVIVHGWDYTLDESVRLYEDYRKTIGTAMTSLRKDDPNFEPYFVFVTWNSVTRPVSEATRSLMPWSLAEPVRDVAGLVDQVVFHIPSAWGESQKALRIALGNARRWSGFDPTSYPKPGEPSEYDREIAAHTLADLPATFPGYDVPLSVLVDQMIRMKRAAPQPFALHVVGHSFGGKIASNATLDAIARVVAAEAVAGTPTSGPLVDSLVLLLPAMRPVEMYKKVELDVDQVEGEERENRLKRLAPLRENDAQSGFLRVIGKGKPYVSFAAVTDRIAHKVVVNSGQDSANGWIFALSETLISHNAIAEVQEHFLPYDTFGERYSKANGWGKVGWFAPAMVEGAATFACKGVYVVCATVASDVSALLWDGPASQFKRAAHEEHWWSSVVDVLAIPLSPFLIHRSVGNTGLVEVKPAVSFVDLRGTWLTRTAADRLAHSPELSRHEFEVATEAPRVPIAKLTPGEFLACDATSVYDGHVATMGSVGKVVNLLDGGAHGDIRSFDPVPIDDDAKNSVVKRARTFFFVYNVTRWPEVAAASGAASR
jgi:pimeloyl-ACP methyl ester carboxylesterase